MTYQDLENTWWVERQQRHIRHWACCLNIGSLPDLLSMLRYGRHHYPQNHNQCDHENFSHNNGCRVALLYHLNITMHIKRTIVGRPCNHWRRAKTIRLLVRPPTQRQKAENIPPAAFRTFTGVSLHFFNLEHWPSVTFERITRNR